MDRDVGDLAGKQGLTWVPSMRYCAGVSSPSFETSCTLSLAGGSTAALAAANEELVDVLIDGAESPYDDHEDPSTPFAIGSCLGG